MYRIWLEDVLGFHLSGSKLTMKPVIPQSWPGFQIRYRFHSATYQIEVLRTDKTELSIDLDGRSLEDVEISFKDDGALHKVTVRVPYAPVEVEKRLLTKVGG
jgi:cellobiose phosphorylase